MQFTALSSSVSHSIVEMEERHRRAVIDLFNYYVRNSFAAYPEEEVGYGFFDVLRKMCHEGGALVAENETGEVIAFALLRPYHLASTFKQTAEISYFILPAHTHKGLGRRILDRIVEIARSKGINCLVASVSSRNQESLNFHRKSGFEECGHLRDVGIKFGKGFGVVWFRRAV